MSDGPELKHTPAPGVQPGPGARFSGLVPQFTGIAAWGVIIGLATVIVPLAFHQVFYLLPIAGLLAGVQAIRRGKMAGGVIAVVLSVLGGILTLNRVLG